MRRTSLAATLALSILSASSCRSSGDPAAPSGNVPVQGVKVTPQVVQLLAVGDTQRVIATVAPANATDKVLSWNSTDPTIASVDATGLVTAKAAGVGVFVTAYTHDGGHQASVNVSVAP